ncbi:MAG: ABC transporter ATP-binding protein [Lachnospiraceae bacterium]|nr:ABC transporter ATP-binding protein [Lachnospiraceae bacterium]
MKKEELNEKTTKKETEHSLISNYWFLYKGFFRNSRWNILFTAMIIIGGLASTYLGLYIPKTAVALVAEKVSVGRLVGTLFGMELIFYLFWQSQSVGNYLISNPGLKYRHVLEERILEKICRTPYSNLEDSEYKKMISQAQQLYYHWDRDARTCIWDSLYLLHLLITIPVTSGLLVTLHPAVILVMAAGTWLQYQAGKRPLAWEKKHRDAWIPLERKSSYISERMGNFSYVKDMRLYAADRWLLPKYKGLLGERRKWKKKQRLQAAAMGLWGKLVEMIKQTFVYGFLIWGVLEGRVKPDDFVLYVGLALSLSYTLSNVSGALRAVREDELSIADYRKMMGRPDTRRSEEPEERKGDFGERSPEVRTDSSIPYGSAGEFSRIPEGQAPGITFSHVSFRYYGAREDALKDVDITIRPGEKIALVGLNGAGKTTLIKLLCGMYEPTEGEILLDGKTSTRWSLEEWYQMFSVVFQDTGVLPATILENVAACAPEEADRKRVRECLDQAGLLEKVESLPHGMDTYVQKEIFREGVNLSGGETQKLLLARAIYREAPILVLDEPTAALDAIAENQLYQKYNELTRGRTSLFISHRLASTRFCDRIIMLEDGHVVEQGSHEELMEKKGVYYQLFQVQSHYYQKDRAEGFSSQMDPTWEVSGYVSN